MFNQNSGYGAALFKALHAAVPTLGRLFIVMNSSDTGEENYQRVQEVFRPDPLGKIRFYNDLEEAASDIQSDNNDALILDGNSTHTLSAMLSLTQNRVHLIGLDWLLGIRRAYGQSTKISLGVTTAATDLGTVSITGTRCTMRGIKVINGNTVAEGLYGVLDGGEYTYLENCEIYKSTDLDVTGAAELVANGDSSNYINCYIGSTVNAIAGAIIRPCFTMSRELAGTGKVARRRTVH